MSQALGQLADELLGVRRPDRVRERLRIDRPVEHDVVPHGGVEEERVLGHHAEVAPIARLREIPDVRSVVADRSGVDVEEAEDEVAKRRLTRTAGSDDGDRLATSDLDGDIGEHRPARLVGERYGVQHDAPLQGTGRLAEPSRMPLCVANMSSDARGISPRRGQCQALPEDDRQRPEELLREIEEQGGRLAGTGGPGSRRGR